MGGAAQIKAIKKVSGTLRLDLASFRELEAFTQFGSDLDDATKARLERGKRTVEILKQGLHDTMPVENQVLSIYALTRGFLDSVKLSDIRRFEKGLHSYFEENKAANELLKAIRETKSLPDEQKLAQAVTSYKLSFV